MNCPRCAPRGGRSGSPYRGDVPRGGIVALVPLAHADAGVALARCPACHGAFAEHEALVAIENAARRKRRGPSLEDAARRAYDPPTEAIACPSCAGETTRREWSIGTMVFVDVCVECRGVWLDGGELEMLGG